jgi:hypothetical protein
MFEDGGFIHLLTTTTKANGHVEQPPSCLLNVDYNATHPAGQFPLTYCGEVSNCELSNQGRLSYR